MITANSVMKDIWMAASRAYGEEMTINRNQLYYLLLKLEKEQYEKGWDKGYETGLAVAKDEFDIDEVEWAGLE